MRVLSTALLVAAALTFSASAVAAQENDVKVVDEVVAAVNDGVITLSSIKRELKGIVDSKVQEGMKREDAQKMVDEKRGELIANLINEELLLQRAKEMGLEKEIDLGRMLDRCPNKDRALIEKSLKGYSAEEIAETEGISSTGIRVRLLRIRQNLRQEFALAA